MISVRLEGKLGDHIAMVPLLAALKVEFGGKIILRGKNKNALDFLNNYNFVHSIEDDGPADFEIPFPPNNGDSSYLDQVFSHFNLIRYTVIHPGAGSPLKRCSLDILCKVAEKTDFPIFLLGPEESWMEIPFNSIQGLCLESVSELLLGAKNYIGNDSGISHLAASLGVPAVVLFGPTDPKVWAHRNVTILRNWNPPESYWPTAEEIFKAL